jgi:hypothetical protein
MLIPFLIWSMIYIHQDVLDKAHHPKKPAKKCSVGKAKA